MDNGSIWSDGFRDAADAAAVFFHQFLCGGETSTIFGCSDGDAGKGSSRFRDTGACGDYRQFYVSDYEFVCNANLSRNFCEYHQSVAGHGDSEFSDGVFLADMLLRSIGTMFVPQVVCRYSTETDLREDRQCRNGVMRRLEKQVRQREEIERSMCRSVFFSMEWRNRKRKEEILRKAKKRLKRCLRSFYAS